MGYVCGLTECYSPHISTFIITETSMVINVSNLASTIASIIVTTSTTVIIPTETNSDYVKTATTPKLTVSAMTSEGTSSIVSKIVLSYAVPKTNSITIGSKELTVSQTGGIIGGVIVIFIIVLISTKLVIQRLNKGI